MKRTISKLLGIAALAIAGITSGLVTATPAQAAYAAPFVPAGCTASPLGIQNHPSFMYPYRLDTAPTTTGWFVYCGAEHARYSYVAGTNFRQLKNGPTPPANGQIREKFEANNVILYVFTDVNQAKAKLNAIGGTINVPLAAEGNGIVGYTTIGTVAPVAAGNGTIVMMFEQPKNSSGVPTPIPADPANLINNFNEILAHESGHVINWLATTQPGAGVTPFGSYSAPYRARVASDVAVFNARNGCATSGANSSMWPSAIKTLICNGSGARNASYPLATWPNLRVLNEKVGAGLGTAWSQYFMAAPTDQQYVEMFSQSIAINRVGGNAGPGYTNLDGWISYVYPCTKLYTASVYNLFTPPTASCP